MRRRKMVLFWVVLEGVVVTVVAVMVEVEVVMMMMMMTTKVVMMTTTTMMMMTVIITDKGRDSACLVGCSRRWCPRSRPCPCGTVRARSPAREWPRAVWYPASRRRQPGCSVWPDSRAARPHIQSPGRAYFLCKTNICRCKEEKYYVIKSEIKKQTNKQTKQTPNNKVAYWRVHFRFLHVSWSLQRQCTNWALFLQACWVR